MWDFEEENIGDLSTHEKTVKKEFVQEQENLKEGLAYTDQQIKPKWEKETKKRGLMSAKKPKYRHIRAHKTKEVASITSSNSGKKRKMAMISHLYDNVSKTSAMERAEEVQAYLGNKFLTFVKSMLPSNVSGGYWLSLPANSCRLRLPNHDTIITLADQNGGDYETVYLAGRTGLSGGWRRFSIEHRLLERDVLVFQLIEPSKFKVYIVRENSLSEVDGALGVMDLFHAKQTDCGK